MDNWMLMRSQVSAGGASRCVLHCFHTVGTAAFGVLRSMGMFRMMRCRTRQVGAMDVRIAILLILIMAVITVAGMPLVAGFMLNGCFIMYAVLRMTVRFEFGGR